MTQPLASRSVNQDLYVRALTAAYRSGTRLYDPDLSLDREADIYEIVRREPVITHAIEHRTHAVAGRRWHLLPAREGNEDDRKLAAIFEELLTYVENMPQARYELSLAAVLNRAFAFIQGDRRTIEVDELPPMDWWVCTKLVDIDRRRVRLVPKWTRRPDGSEELAVENELWSVTGGEYRPLQSPELFVKHIYGDEESRLGYGRGLVEAIYYYHYAKTIVMREGLQGLERWAQGFTVVRVDGARKADSKLPNTAVQAAWLDTMETAKARHGLVADKADEVEILHPSGTGHQMVEKWLTYLDRGVTQLITGAVLPSGGGGDVGSNARAEVEADTQEMLVQFDRTILDDTLSRDLIGLLYDTNRANIEAAGLGKARPPRMSTVQEKRDDPEQVARVVRELNAAGLDLVADEIYERTGFTPPQVGDVILPGSEPAPPPDAGGGFLPFTKGRRARRA